MAISRPTPVVRPLDRAKASEILTCAPVWLHAKNCPPALSGRAVWFWGFGASPALGKDLPQHPVGAVAYAGFAQRAVEDYPEAVGLGMGVLKIVRGTFWSHGVGGGRSSSDSVYVFQRLHKTSSDINKFMETAGFKQKRCRLNML